MTGTGTRHKVAASLKRKETLPVKGVPYKKTWTPQGTHDVAGAYADGCFGGQRRRTTTLAIPPALYRQAHPAPLLHIYRHPRTSKKVDTQCRRLSRTFFQRIARSWVLMRTMANGGAAAWPLLVLALWEATKPDGDARQNSCCCCG